NPRWREPRAGAEWLAMADDEAREKAGRDLLYERVADRLRRDIVAGFYPRGTFLPSEADLCTRFEVSRGTLRRALADLARLGLVSSRPGVGHRVAGRLASTEEAENNLVAVLAPYAEGGAYFAEMVGGLERRLADAGIHLIMCSTDERSGMTSQEVLAAQVERLVHMHPRAAVLSGEWHESDPDHLRTFSRASIPVFYVGQQLQGPVAGFVGVDERLGSLVVTDWLIRWSSGVVASIIGHTTPGMEQRLEGYTMARSAHGLLTDGAGEFRFDPAEDSPALAQELTRSARDGRVSFFCASVDDLPAIQRALDEANLTIGEQVAVGCVCSPPWCVPTPSIPLVAAQWSAAEMGEAAAGLIVQWLTNGDAPSSHQRLAAPRLIVNPAYGAYHSFSGTTPADVKEVMRHTHTDV
ncbi:MAG: GntR family transcriptional regulator, partial [Armatimonadetes bacterium]|nr:GntR family transcriptional regulator [Armatimonadota bacterium]